MKNQKIFIGNLSFSATEDDVRTLLSETGTVVSLRFSRKKGHAVAEMSDSDESEAAIKNLNGKPFMDRTLRVNFELPSGKAKSESVKRYNDKGKSLSEERSEAYPKGDRKKTGSGRTETRQESRSGGRSDDRNKPKSHDSFKSAPKGNRRDDSDDSRGNRKHANESEAPRDRDSAGGYYSQSFRKRVEKAASAFSKFTRKGTYTEDAPDDFMKDEHGRDYRDMAKEAERKRSGSRRPGQVSRSGQSSDGNSGYSHDRPSRPQRRETTDGDHRRSEDRPRPASAGRGGRTSGAGSDSRHGESRDGARKTYGRPASSGERSSGGPKRGNSRGDQGGGQSRASSGSRPADRSRNKQR
jgi:RNA recognition motif-containing protein